MKICPELLCAARGLQLLLQAPSGRFGFGVMTGAVNEIAQVIMAELSLLLLAGSAAARDEQLAAAAESEPRPQDAARVALATGAPSVPRTIRAGPKGSAETCPMAAESRP